MLKSLLHFLGVRAARPFYGGAGSILALHRVVPEPLRSRLKSNRALEITPEDLDGMISLLKRWDYDFIPMDDVPLRLRTARRRFVAFTLDDGYLDNLEHALPVFRQHGVPFCVYATRSFAEHAESVWWFALEQLICSRERIVVRSKGREEQLSLTTNEERERAFDVLAKWVRSCQFDERRELLGAMFEGSDIDPMSPTRKLMMNAAHLQEISREPLVSLGAHALHHLTSNILSESALRVEFAASKKWLQALIGQPVKHLAYPFGGKNSVGTREFVMARECGFVTAVTTRFGNLFRQHVRRLHQLPRLEISGNYRVIPFTERAVSGLLPAMRNRWRRMVRE